MGFRFEIYRIAMNNYLFTFISLLILNCATTAKQDSLKIIKEESGTLIFKGFLTCSDLEKEKSFEWYQTNYNSYNPDSSNLLSNKYFKNLKIIVFMGTWCSDSKREIPRFFKILNNCNVSLNQVTIFGLDRSKKTEDSVFNSKYNILRVPTFIFFRNEKELGRIVEFPKESLEKDIQKILSN